MEKNLVKNATISRLVAKLMASTSAAGCSGDTSGCKGQCSEKGCNKGTNDGESLSEFPIRVLRWSGSKESLSQHVRRIDLTMVKSKLCQPAPEGKSWTPQKADTIEEAYKIFLLMTATVTEYPVVPTLDVDAMWHQHILDTRAYAKDCQNVFGEFLHHFPYFGLRSAADAENLTEAFRRTQNDAAEYAKCIGCIEEAVAA